MKAAATFFERLFAALCGTANTLGSTNAVSVHEMADCRPHRNERRLSGACREHCACGSRPRAEEIRFTRTVDVGLKKLGRRPRGVPRTGFARVRNGRERSQVDARRRRKFFPVRDAAALSGRKRSSSTTRMVCLEISLRTLRVMQGLIVDWAGFDRSDEGAANAGTRFLERRAQGNREPSICEARANFQNRAGFLLRQEQRAIAVSKLLSQKTAR